MASFCDGIGYAIRMAKMNYDKAARTQLFHQSVREAWSGHVPGPRIPPSPQQIAYLQALLLKADRRQYTDDELAIFTKASISRLINELKYSTK